MFHNKAVSDVVAGLIAILIGIVSIIEAVRLYPMKVSVMVGDHTMPALLGIIMVVLGTLLIFVIKGGAFKAEFSDRNTMRVMIGIGAAMFGYWIMMEYLGYVVSTLLSALFLFRLTGSYPWIRSALYASATTAVIYLIFVYWLNMVLPEGLL